MKLTKAKALLKREIKDPGSIYEPDLSDALQLGVEALNRIISLRLEPDDYEITHLPGETKE